MVCVCVSAVSMLALALVSVKEKQRNTDIRAKANIETAQMMVKKRRLRWLGHVARMDAGHIPRQLLLCRPETGKVQLEDRNLDGQILSPRT